MQNLRSTGTTLVLIWHNLVRTKFADTAKNTTIWTPLLASRSLHSFKLAGNAVVEMRWLSLCGIAALVLHSALASEETHTVRVPLPH